MKKIYITLSLACATALITSAQTKFDAGSLNTIAYYKDLKANHNAEKIVPVQIPFDLNQMSRSGEAEVGVIIKLAPGESFDAIEAAGLTIMSRIGDDMCVANGYLDDIIALDRNDAVEALSIDTPVRPLLNKARSKSGVDDVHNGTGLSRGYTGKGVVCGIFDSGVDPNHINFYDKEFTGGSRVKEVHHYTNDTGTRISYTTPDAIARFQTDDKTETHGTHTMGILTGAFMLKGNKSASTYPTGSAAIFSNAAETAITALASTANPYYGVAYDGDIVACCGRLTNTNTISAVQNVVDYAVAHKQPAVVNLSLGNNSGSHDGYDTFGQAMERLSKNAIICVSSGNEGDQNISIVKTLTAADKSLKTCLTFSSKSTGILDIYGSDKNTFKYTVAVIDKTNGAVKMQKEFNTEGSTTLATSNYTAAGYIHDAVFDQAFNTSYLIIAVSDNKTTSGRHSIQMQYSLQSNDSSLGLAIFIEGNAGQRIDIVHSVVSGNGKLTSGNLAGYSNPTPDMTANNLACSPYVIAVGAWTSRGTWPALDRGTYWFGQNDPMHTDKVSPFTSYGVLYDGRVVPHICAPGAGLVSSINSYYTELKDPSGTDNSYSARFKYKNRNYVWGCQAGTSMASPFAAGVVATWLEANPNLTVTEVKDIMLKTADKLDYTASATQAGGGRLNAINGLKMVLNSASGVNDIIVDGKDKNIVISNNGNLYEVFNAAGNVSVTVFNLNGQPVKSASSNGNEVEIDLGTLAKGIYILNVNGLQSERIAVN